MTDECHRDPATVQLLTSWPGMVRLAWGHVQVFLTIDECRTLRDQLNAILATLQTPAVDPARNRDA
jgi:hypothetical protein